MKMILNLKNSIYKNGYNGASPDLRIEGGQLINDRPDSRMGLQKMADARRTMKYERKVQMIADGNMRAERMEEMNKMMGMSSCCGKPNCDC
jgi:hypothetical protein